MTRVPTCASSQLKRFRKSSGSTQQWRYEYRHEPSATSTRSRARGNQLRFLLRGRCSARWPAKGVDAKRGQALADVIGTIAPYVENGQVAGARIGRPGSLFRAVGIERGDVVVQVNGESFTSAQSLLPLLAELAHAQSFELVVRSSAGATRTVRCADRSTGCL